MDDEQFEKLAREAQEHPAGSLQRRRALNRLLVGLLSSRRLCYPRKGEFGKQYEDIRNEAVQNLMLYICQNIDKYDPERAPFVRWANYLLKKRFFAEAIPKVLSNEVAIEGQEGLELPALEPEVTAAQRIRECIERDEENLFRSKVMSRYPHVNFQLLALKRCDGCSWKDISAELGVGISTLSDFYQRCIKNKEFRTYFENYLQA